MSATRRKYLAFMLALTSVGFSLRAGAVDLYVIANVPVQLSPAELREIFLGERQFANGQRLVVIDNLSAMPRFVAAACGIDVSRYRTVWAKKGFREGLNPPLQLAGDRDVAALVLSTPGAIGYVTVVPRGMSVIATY